MITPLDFTTTEILEGIAWLEERAASYRELEAKHEPRTETGARKIAREYELAMLGLKTLLSPAFVARLGALPETSGSPRDGSQDAVEPADWHNIAAQYCCACGDPVITAVVVTRATGRVARYDLPVCHACADNHVEHGAIDRREATDSRAA